MKINEIFYSLQGEGYHTGRAGVFVRFSKCNLRCPFCDTSFDDYTEMTEEEVVQKVIEADTGKSRFVILTGGEPTMQLTNSFLELLHDKGYYVAIETNGAWEDTDNFELDWVTVSPKAPFLLNGRGKLILSNADEVKLVVDKDNVTKDTLQYYKDNVVAKFYYLQPCDTQNEQQNIEIINKTLSLIKSFPKWKLSLQTQKILQIR